MEREQSKQKHKSVGERGREEGGQTEREREREKDREREQYSHIHTNRAKQHILGREVVVVVVVAFSSLARTRGKCSTINCQPEHFFFFFLKWRLARAH